MNKERYATTVNCSGPPEFEFGREIEVELVKDGNVRRPGNCPNFIEDGEMCTFRGKQAYCKYVRVD